VLKPKASAASGDTTLIGRRGGEIRPATDVSAPRGGRQRTKGLDKRYCGGQFGRAAEHHRQILSTSTQSAILFKILLSFSKLSPRRRPCVSLTHT
jgi:hypothetical protein